MEIRDVLHGSISIASGELPIIDSRSFQRLRQIKQLGFAEYSYPSASHNRYIHSLGAMSVASKAFDSIFGGSPLLGPTAFRRFRRVVRLAALLHDVGHGPLSHSIEFAMPESRTLAIPGAPGIQAKGKARKASHEDYTLKFILDSELSPLIAKAGKETGFGPEQVAALLEGEGLDLPKSDFFLEKVEGETIDFRPILRQLISSELDADRMDYLRRDSLHAGVSYGQFDFNWLVGNLSWHIKNGKCFLALQHRALYALEDFLISRYHMFLMVYFHYKTVVYDEMLRQYLSSEDCTYTLPSDIEAYCHFTDAHLYAHLEKEPKNEWARRIIERRPYRMLIELHSGIPATKTAFLEQKRLLTRVERELTSQSIRYLNATSTSELSKYFGKPGDPIFVLYDNHYSKPSSIPLEQCTDLFQRYAEKREITRLYVSPENYPLCRHQGRSEPLPYEDSEHPGPIST